MHHTARSGSTLLCQIFWRLPNTQVLADPFIQNYINMLYLQGHISKKEAALMAINATRLQAKPLLQVMRQYISSLG